MALTNEQVDDGSWPRAEDALNSPHVRCVTVTTGPCHARASTTASDPEPVHWPAQRLRRLLREKQTRVLVRSRLARSRQSSAYGTTLTMPDTSYAELSEKEKESDREQVRKYLPLIVQALADQSGSKTMKTSA